MEFKVSVCDFVDPIESHKGVYTGNGTGDLTERTVTALTPSKKSSAAFRTSLAVTTVMFIVVQVVNAIAALPIALKVGLKNTTAGISDEFYTQVTPAGLTFAVWGVIYVWQAVWIGYGWTFVLKSSTTAVPFSAVTLNLYTCSSILNIAWIILWGLELPQYSFPVIFLFELFLYAATHTEGRYLFNVERSLNYYTAFNNAGSDEIMVARQQVNQLGYNLNVARYLVLNGLAVYASWITVANLINLAIVLEYFGPFSASFAGTVSLVLLGADVVIYFILENTLIGNFSRYVFMVYPTLIWALSGVLLAHAGDPSAKTNELITLVLLGGSVVILTAKAVIRKK